MTDDRLEAPRAERMFGLALADTIRAEERGRILDILRDVADDYCYCEERRMCAPHQMVIEVIARL